MKQPDDLQQFKDRANAYPSPRWTLGAGWILLVYVVLPGLVLGTAIDLALQFGWGICSGPICLVK